jgi:hypothetical protein
VRLITGGKWGHFSVNYARQKIGKCPYYPPVSSLPISLVILDMQADKDNGRAFKKTSNCVGAAGNSERVTLLTSGRFNHSVEILKIKTGMVPKLLKSKWQ